MGSIWNKINYGTNPWAVTVSVPYVHCVYNQYVFLHATGQGLRQRTKVRHWNIDKSVGYAGARVTCTVISQNEGESLYVCIVYILTYDS